MNVLSSSVFFWQYANVDTTLFGQDRLRLTSLFRGQDALRLMCQRVTTGQQL